MVSTAGEAGAGALGGAGDSEGGAGLGGGVGGGELGIGGAGRGLAGSGAASLLLAGLAAVEGTGRLSLADGAALGADALGTLTLPLPQDARRSAVVIPSETRNP